MSEPTERDKLLSYLKKVSADLYQARERLRKLEAAEQEPVAIVGMGCRYPGGVHDPEGLWELVASGTDAIGPFPADRGWQLDEPGDDAEPGFSRSGGFIDGLAQFDPAFFGISPREALAMDPQQRLLLQVSWEALERSGLDPLSLRGSRTGVFVGGSFSGYTAGITGGESEGYLMTGGHTAVLSGRVAYTLGLEGPAVTIDTACSSSLLAMHLAAQSLRSQECSIALAGGVSVLVIPSLFAEFSKQQGMAADGRCKAFGAGADGIGWAEGVGMVVMEKLSTARRAGHRVLAVITGSAANSDGASNGLTAPNGPSQRRVIRAALAAARLSPSDVDAVEAHGTGTTLGDPIEAQALIETYGQDRPAGRPLWLGSVKSNLGHPQAAGGVAGVIKMVQALRHETLPPTLHADMPSPHVDWSAGDIRLLTGPVPWPAAGTAECEGEAASGGSAPGGGGRAARRRRAGVSAFGVSGTNVHLILEEAPDGEGRQGTASQAGQDTGPLDAAASRTAAGDPGADSAAGEAPPVLAADAGPTAWLVSGRSPAALAAQASRLAGFLTGATAGDGPDPADVAWSLATTRSAFEQRAVVTGADRAGLLVGLAAVAASQPSAAVITGEVPAGDRGRVVFVFPGQGSQWIGMGTELARVSPVFAARLAECSAALEPYTGWRLEDALAGPAAGERPAPSLDRVDVVQPALWAVMVSLAAVWQAAGVTPDAVAGHSQGEIAAAVVAGLLTLEDAARVVALRARALTALAGRGGMASVAEPAGAVAGRIAVRGGQLSVAAVNGPAATVVSGDPAAIAELVAACKADGVRASVLPVDYASHGPQVEELEAEIIAALEVIDPRPAAIPMISAMTGELLDGPQAGPGYWYDSLRAPVQFQRAVEVLAAGGHQYFIECSPHPVLAGAITDALELSATTSPVVVGTLRRDDGGAARLLTSLAEAYVAGAGVDWTRILPSAGRVALPTYAFQEQRFWVDPLTLTDDGTARVGGAAASGRESIAAGPGTTAEARFWAAVDHGDPAALARLLVPEGRTGTDERSLAELLPLLSGWRQRVLADLAVADWRYHVCWVPVAEAPVGNPVRLTGTWLLVAPAGSAADARSADDSTDTPATQSAGTLAMQCAAALAASGARVVTITADPATVTRDELAQQVRAAVAAEQHGPPLAGVLSLLATDERPASGFDVVPAGLSGTLALIQALGDAGEAADGAVTGQPAGPVPLWVVTQGAVGAAPGEVPARPLQAMTWGLGRTAGVEHPGRWGGLIDLPPAPGDQEPFPAGPAAALAGFRDTAQSESLARLTAVLAADGQAAEDEIAIRAGGLFARRLNRASAPAEPGTWRPTGSVLVTGASGAIGPDLADWLARCGAPRVVLVGRRGPATPGAAQVAAALAASGTEVVIASGDLTEREQVAGLLHWGQARGPAWSAVIHVAVAVELKRVADVALPDLALAVGAKARGAAVLDELTADLDLDAFVLFSSIAATWGVAEHGSYAAANAYLDALAQARRARGLSATSVAWGVWSSGGRFDEDSVTDDRPESLVPRRLARQGLRLLDPGRALSVLRQVLAEDETCLAVADVDWGRFAPVFTAARQWRLLDQIAEAGQPAADGTSGRAGAGALATGLRAVGPAERERRLTDLVRSHAAAVLGLGSASDVAAGRAFRDMGFDSLTAIELRNQLNAATGLTLPSTVVFDYPSALALARQVGIALLGDDPAEATISVSTVPVSTVPAASGLASTVSSNTGAADPVVIVGMGCRFPGGADSPEALWSLLAAGADAVGPFPADRGWDIGGLFNADPDQPGTSYTSEGGFIAGAADFDPGFFGISPREALAMDPQQRLLLETAWEAIERAGIDPATLRGTQTGVFAGAAASGYAGAAVGRLHGAEAHLITGNVTSVISGRVCYALGMEGPAVTVDTACSSALVALHLAVRALRAGECDLALAGGVMIIADPAEFIGFSRQRALAADGRCKAYAGAADGMGLAEGAGLVALERLSDARRNGHQVLAVVAGSAVNSDGASNGLTAPNGPSQQRVIRAALASAGLSPADVDAVEGHGTGTRLGDPIEAQALLATYGRDRQEGRPLWLGSVKSNIGHAQQAAGIAGIIKMVLALQHGQLPATLHVDEPSPHVDWSAGQVRLLTEPVAWPATDGRKRRAGISSFGISGTNAHVILEEAPAAPAGTCAGRLVPVGPPVLTARTGLTAWPVSGRTAAALAAQADRLARFAVGDPSQDPAAVAQALAATRTAFEHRAIVIGSDQPSLVTGLRMLTAGQPAQTPAPMTPGPSTPASAATVSGAVPADGDIGQVAFVFPGQGGQWAGMGTELLAVSPVFATRLAECSAALGPLTGWRVEDVLGDPAALERVDVVQPALWAVMVSLAAVWQAAGVTPDAVVGHSQGEIAAAVVAGVLSLEDAATVVALRARALLALSGRGGMASLAEPAERVTGRLTAYGSRLAVAAVNGPAATVVSGDPQAIKDLVAACAAEGVRARVLPVDYASHGPAVEELEAEITSALDGVEPRPATIPMLSAMTGRPVAGPELDAGYWYASLRAPVRFADAVRTLAASGHRAFIEVAPHPVLAAAVSETAEAAGAGPVVVTGTLRRGDGGPARLLTSLATAHVAGLTVRWSAVLPPAPRAALPTYAFQHQRYWPSGPRSALAPGHHTGEAGRDGAGTAAEARFWAAVSGGDAATLADVLAVDARRPFAEVLPALASWRDRVQAESAADLWRYQVSWVPVAEPAPATMTGTWLLAVPVAAAGQPDEPAGELARDQAAVITAVITAAGGEVVTVTADPARSDRAGLAASVATALNGGSSAAAPAAVSGIVSLLALAEAPLPGLSELPTGLAATVTLLQSLGDAGVTAPLWAVTQGAVAVAGEALARPMQAHAWGLGRVAALEYPDRWGGLIDLPGELTEQALPGDRTAARLVAVLSDCGEDQVALRPAGLFARRLTRAPRPAASPAGQPAWRPRGTALVTGGTGAVGGHVARWLADRGADRVVLTSRTGPAAPGAARLAAGLAAAGTTVRIAACDSSRRADLAGLLDRLAADGERLSAVFHAAGNAPGEPLADTSPGSLAGILAPKAAGAACLDELTAAYDLDAFVLFSSGAATWGSAGLGGYAAANAYLDALAENRRARGLVGTSVAWGLWGGGGMGEGNAGTQLKRLGLREMDPRPATAALARALDDGATALTVADIDWERFAPVFTLRRAAPLLTDLPEARAALRAQAGEEPAAATSALSGQLAGLPRAGQERLLTDLVRAQVAAVLGYAGTDAVEPARAFKDLGFDSVTALEFRNRLGAATGITLPATLVYDHPSPAATAAYLRSELIADGADGEDPVLADLGRLESSLRGLDVGADLRDEITSALRGILSHWIERRYPASPEAEPDSGSVAFQDATPDEVFEFLDKELG